MALLPLVIDVRLCLNVIHLHILLAKVFAVYNHKVGRNRSRRDVLDRVGRGLDVVVNDVAFNTGEYILNKGRFLPPPPFGLISLPLRKFKVFYFIWTPCDRNRHTCERFKTLKFDRKKERKGQQEEKSSENANCNMNFCLGWGNILKSDCDIRFFTGRGNSVFKFHKIQNGKFRIPGKEIWKDETR